jgi:hypothetical protein
MSKDWKLIRKNNAWAEVLTELIKDAKAAIKSGAAMRAVVRADLRNFIDQSPNFDDTVPIDKYDEVAARLHKQLVQADLEDELAQLESRAPDFAAILGELRAITGEANNAAETISLNRVRKIVDSVADAVESLNEVRDSINADDDPNLAKSLDELLKAFKSLQTRLGT